MVSIFGDYDDNGTLQVGTWSESGYTLHSDVDYDENTTYYMYLDGLGITQLEYLKILSTFTTENGKLMVTTPMGTMDTPTSIVGMYAGLAGLMLMGCDLAPIRSSRY